MVEAITLESDFVESDDEVPIQPILPDPKKQKLTAKEVSIRSVIKLYNLIE